MRGEEGGITGREEKSWLWMDGCQEESMPAVKKIVGTGGGGFGALGEKALSSSEYTGLSLQKGMGIPCLFQIIGVVCKNHNIRERL